MRVVHLGVGPVADAETTFEAIVDALPSRLPHATLDESTLAKLPPLFLSVLRIWQRYPSVALQDRQEMAERLQKAATYVGELFLQVCLRSLASVTWRAHWGSFLCPRCCSAVHQSLRVDVIAGVAVCAFACCLKH